MKSGRYFFILFLILLIIPSYAQKGVDITGTVIEEGTNIGYAERIRQSIELIFDNNQQD